RSTVDPRELLLWRFDLEAFLRWLALQLNLKGGVRQIDDRLWQLGTAEEAGTACECFFQRGGSVYAAASERLKAYRTALVLYGLSRPAVGGDHSGIAWRSLLSLLQVGRSLRVSGLPLLSQRGAVRFDARSGALWAGDVWLGEVPVGSKEFAFLECLA